MSESPKELQTKCGIFGFYSFNEKRVVSEVVEGLSKLQHRGQEGAGVSYLDSRDRNITTKNLGFVEEVFKDSQLELVWSKSALGHVRYSTSGSKNKHQNIQPLGNSNVVIAHNGNVPKIPDRYVHHIVHDHTDYHDTTTLLRIIDTFDPFVDNGYTMLDHLQKLVERIPGAYCLAILAYGKFYVVRDRYGIRPLCLGKSTQDESWWVSSESCAFPDHVKRIRDVEPGEIIEFRDDGGTTSRHGGNGGLQNSKNESGSSNSLNSLCLFEYIYFLRPGTIADGTHVEHFRKKCGTKLAEKENIVFSAKDTVVVGAPYTGLPSAKTFAKCLGLPYSQLLNKTKKRRTFILPSERDKACETIYKYNPNEISGKRIVLIDDSIVRGTTLKSIAEKFWEYGAKEIHIRIASPPVVSECFFGIDIPTKNELIASRLEKNTSDMSKEMTLTSLEYMSLDSLFEILGSDGYCSGCFTGKYPRGLLDW